VKVGEIYRLKAFPSYTIEIISVTDSATAYLLYPSVRRSHVRYLTEVDYSDFVLYTKLDRLLEGLDEI
jgi:hypothetical protein